MREVVLVREVVVLVEVVVVLLLANPGIREVEAAGGDCMCEYSFFLITKLKKVSFRKLSSRNQTT